MEKKKSRPYPWHYLDKGCGGLYLDPTFKRKEKNRSGSGSTFGKKRTDSGSTFGKKRTDFGSDLREKTGSGSKYDFREKARSGSRSYLIFTLFFDLKSQYIDC